jgi:hypothetical protein
MSGDDRGNVGKALRESEAASRSGWDTYAGAIAAARAGDVGRLIDLLRARRPLCATDRKDLINYILTKRRRRLWPPLVVDALCGAYDWPGRGDVLADFVGQIGRRRGRLHDNLVHRAARLAEVIMSLVPGKVSNDARNKIVAYAYVIISNETGAEVPLEMATRRPSEEAPSVPITGGCFIVGKDSNALIDPQRVQDALDKIENLFNRIPARRRKTG